MHVTLHVQHRTWFSVETLTSRVIKYYHSATAGNINLLRQSSQTGFKILVLVLINDEIALS